MTDTPEPAPPRTLRPWIEPSFEKEPLNEASTNTSGPGHDGTAFCSS